MSYQCLKLSYKLHFTDGQLLFLGSFFENSKNVQERAKKRLDFQTNTNLYILLLLPSFTQILFCTDSDCTIAANGGSCDRVLMAPKLYKGERRS